jgi:AcrR family transcriptional regulator
MPPAESAPMDRRAARTRHALHAALMELILKTDYDEISVQDIVDAANVGRSTFYAHYTGKDDLLRNGSEWLKGMLVEHRSQSAGPSNALWFSLVMFQHTREWRTLYRAMVSGRAGPIFLDMMRRMLIEFAREELAVLKPTASEREVAVQFLVGGFMSVLTWWLDRGAKESPEDIDDMFRSLVFHGLR